MNVGYDVFERSSPKSPKRRQLKAKEWVDHRDRATRKSAGPKPKKTAPTRARSWTNRWSTQPDPPSHPGHETAVETQIFPTRKETPRPSSLPRPTATPTTSSTSCARSMARATPSAKGDLPRRGRRRQHPASFPTTTTRASPFTVDMIATGTDVKPLECCSSCATCAARVTTSR